MSITPGTRLGPYEILAALGAGGMGEVYRARDTRLDRTVAIKVLPAQLADDPQFRDRFEREAKAIAALTHPNICTLHDVGHQDGTDYLVMEYLDGETLQDRLAKGALPLEQALKTAIEIASALDKAHRAGIVHRDLKPGNVMLTKTGAKLLDFGLAKASAPVIAGAGLSMLPTTPPNLTAQGTVLGTFQYMAPEQLEGVEADARTDIFAFGVVVYEMVTGKKAFEGKSQASLIAAIIHVDPAPISALQPLTPPELDRVIKKCLAKEPVERWQTAKDLCDELKWITESRTQVDAKPPASRSAGNRMVWLLVGLAGVLGLSATAMKYWSRQVLEPKAVRLMLTAPLGTTMASGVAEQPVISPDGQRVVMVAHGADGVNVLWVRPLDSLAAQAVSGSGGAQAPFWSPDGRSIAFFAGDMLKKADLATGSIYVVCRAQGADRRGGTWNRDDVILFSSEVGRGLFRVSASGGQPTQITTPDSKAENGHFRPSFLPDGRHYLYLAQARQNRDDAVSNIFVGALDSLDRRVILQVNSEVRYAPPGYLLFVANASLMAQRFDATQMTVTGQPSPLAAGVMTNLSSGGASAFSVSQTGVVMYAPDAGTKNQLTWFDRTGRALGTVGPPDDYNNPQLSPNGESVAVQVRRVDPQSVVGRIPDAFVLRFSRNVFSRFAADARMPLWSPDGSRIVWLRTAQGSLYEKRSDGGEEVELLKAGRGADPEDWSKDGRFILYAVLDAKTNRDLWVLPLAKGEKPFPLLHTEANEIQGQISPDGHWLAYMSDESGRSEIYLQRFPGLGEKSPVSSQGGRQPRWRRDGKELFYVALDGKLMAAAVSLEPRVSIGESEALFQSHVFIDGLFGYRASYDVAADGRRFLLNVPLSNQDAPDSVVILNWVAALKP